SSARTTVSEAAAADPGTGMPTTVAIETQSSKYVSDVAYSAGTITVTATADVGGSVAATHVITLAGTKQANGQVTWICGGTGTTVEAKYRPATCQGN
ncbi:MAG: pilin, partial [Prosthecobacter sp.]|nr:pilin [Prosthecobacter sp.]